MILKNIILGKYYNTDSFVHNLDPRTKFLSLIMVLLAVTMVSNFYFLGGLLLFLFFAILLSDISICYFLRQLIPFIWIILITFFLHIIFTDGRILLQIPGVNFRLTYEGLYNGIFYGFRIILLLAFSSLFMLTTSPVDITDGMEVLFKPLKKLKIPVDKFALIVSISLRFIPTIFEEAERIKKAQIARGAEIEKGIVKRIQNVTSIIIPVFVSVFRRADELAIALEARGYPPKCERTYYRSINFKISDFYILFFVFLLISTFLFFDKYIFG